MFEGRFARTALVAAVALGAASTLPSAFAGAPTESDLVDARLAVLKVYAVHRGGSSAGVGIADARELVRADLAKSAALEAAGRPVTAADLQAELNRMARTTRDPERLRELFAALGDDPVLAAETLARPALVDRLLRGVHALDPAQRGRGRATGKRRAADPLAEATAFDAWWNDARRGFERRSPHAVPASGLLHLPALGGLRERGGGWAPMRPGQEDPRVGHTAVWTGAEMIVWGGDSDTGRRYDPVTDTWSDVSRSGAPSARSGHTAVWTGHEMIVWGGGTTITSNAVTADGARYDPATDRWTALPAAGAPSARTHHVAVWTGRQMLVWGGADGNAGVLASGAAYDATTNRWSALPTGGAPSARRDATAVWTGHEMIVWGGLDASGGAAVGGARLVPGAGAWAPVSATAAPEPRYAHTATWTGHEMIVWGGSSDGGWALDDGALYDPLHDAWTALPGGGPSARFGHTAAWTGGQLVIWGGATGGGGGWPVSVSDGAVFDPRSNAWTAIPGGPDPRAGHTVVWTGREAIVFGGELLDLYTQIPLASGGAFDPRAARWRATSSGTGPGARIGNTAVWTGAEMIVWGGQTGTGASPNDPGLVAAHADGYRYDPALDAWTRLAAAPLEGRFGHTAAWTGERMIVWGGMTSPAFSPGPIPASDGALYDPAADAWSAMNADGAPDARAAHTAVWTGREMIVWGGVAGVEVNSGARYDPAADAWTPVTTAGAPSARQRHTAVWTGHEMIVWGGEIPTGNDASGGAYDPVADRWTPTSIENAPAPRSGHTAVWTGHAMIVWGGFLPVPGHPTDTGALYDPVADRWTPVSTTHAPRARFNHTAVWTGLDMIAWGGQATDRFDTGARYVPGLDAWVPMKDTGAPSVRAGHTAVWTGKEMIVWGGGTATGGRYASK